MNEIERLVAESDIRKLVALYPQAADDGAYETFSSLFIPDGAIQIGNERMSGRKEISKWLETTHAVGPLRHLMLNPSIELDSPNTAHGKMDMALLVKKDGKWVLTAPSRYNDTFKRTNEGWRFAERVLELR